MNTVVISNYLKLKSTLYILPILLLLAIFIFLYSHDSLSSLKYVVIQKDYFYYINHHLGQYPTFEYNLTQIGDASIFMSFLIIFIIYAPKIWEAILSALLVSVIFSFFLKEIFSVPRPPQILDNSSFIIIGKATAGFASLPSGHSITTFTLLTILMFAFMPKDFKYKILWILSIICIGLIVVSSRIAVGAHYPLDVIIGSIIGYISGISGIFISRKYKIWNWVNNKKYYPIFMLLILVCGISIVLRLINENVILFYLALICLLISLYKISYVYFKK